MDTILFVSGMVALYFMVFFLDAVFKSCMHYPYAEFLKSSGLEVKFMCMRWHTTAFNRAVLRWGTKSNLLRTWLTRSFTLGVAVSLSLLPIGIIVLFMTIFNDGKAKATGTGKNVPDFQSNGVQLEILLPGVNLPLNEIGFYLSTLMLSTVVHEMGHALAAVLEDIPVAGFGFQIYFCIPLAYTEISSEHLSSLKWFKKLRILCAGIWHNLLFAALCYLLLSTLPFTLAPLYKFNENIVITKVSRNSPLRSKADRGLAAGDIIAYINDCQVVSEDSWYGCLLQALLSKPGYCVSSDFIHFNDESVVISHHGTDGVLQCCDNKNRKLCCFEYVDDDVSNAAPVEIPQHVCLDVRRTVEDSAGFCITGGAVCERSFCLRPLLHNSTTILIFKRLTLNENSSRQHDVIYMGHPADVMRTLRVSPFVPKQQSVSPFWGDVLSLFLRYNIVFSIGLALLNAIPCFGVDGSHIASTIINSFLVNRVSERAKRDVIALLVTGTGTILLTLAMLKVLWLSVIPKVFQ